MVEQLSSLLLPIDALLVHNLFDPRLSADLPPEVIPLFRNMWFMCVLFQFTSAEDNADSAMEWRRPALLRIAVKTPAIVLEESRDSLFGDIEYNAVIRQEYAQSVSTTYREYDRFLKPFKDCHKTPGSSDVVHCSASERDSLPITRSSCVPACYA